MHRLGRFFKCSISCTPLIYDLPVFSLVNLHLRWTASAPAFLQTSFSNPFHSGSEVSLCRSGASAQIRYERALPDFAGSQVSSRSVWDQTASHRGRPGCCVGLLRLAAASGCLGTLDLLGVSQLKQSDDKLNGISLVFWPETAQHYAKRTAAGQSFPLLSLSDTHTYVRTHTHQTTPSLPPFLELLPHSSIGRIGGITWGI